MEATAALTRECTVYEEIEVIMEQLHDFVSTIQRPRLLDESWTARMHEASLEIETRIEELRIAFAEKREAWSDTLDEIADTLSNYAKELSEGSNSNRLQSLYRSLEENYEDLFQYLKGLQKDFAE